MGGGGSKKGDFSNRTRILLTLFVFLNSPLKGALPCRSITLFWEIRDYSNGVDDDVLHTFHLQVSIPGGGYNGKTKQVRSTGNAGNNFFNSVQSTDGKWSVTHYGYYYPIHVTLWANGVNHHYYGGNSQWSDWIDDSTGRYYYGEMEFWDCISWYN
jgi:hypothetical protein